MEPQHIGDALDYWKGALLGSLSRRSLLSDLRVDRMTDEVDIADQPVIPDGQWTPLDRQLYAHLLQITTAQILEHSKPLVSREEYFAEIPKSGDVFLDPDVGVATGRCRECHVRIPDIWPVLKASPSRVVAIYQHVRGDVTARVDDVVSAIADASEKRLHWCCYESGTVAMLFLSLDHERPSLIAAHFQDCLNPRTERIRVCLHP